MTSAEGLFERWRWVVAAVLGPGLACACTAAPSEHVDVSPSPIIGGRASDTSQDAVVLVLHRVPGATSVELCSGTLLTPRLVLTARHCVATTDSAVACTSDGIAQSGGVVHGNFDPETIYVYGGARRPSLTSVLSTAVHGAKIIDDQATTLCNHDIGLVTLAEAVPGAKIAPVRLDDTTEAGELVTLVGWGVSGSAELPTTRQQRTGDAILGTGPSPELGLGDAELLIGAGTCSGDSGGPALASSGAVVGLLSRGGTGSVTPEPGVCVADMNVYTKTSAFRDLILASYAEVGQEPWLEGEPNPTLAVLGAACTIDADCQSNLCAPGTKLCTAACSSAACPDGFACTDQLTCVPAPAGSSNGGCAVTRRTGDGGDPGLGVASMMLAFAFCAAARAQRRRHSAARFTPPSRTSAESRARRRARRPRALGLRSRRPGRRASRPSGASAP